VAERADWRFVRQALSHCVTAAARSAVANYQSGQSAVVAQRT
jgi:hypothetical protein